jgi:hypothetical protein
MATLIHAILLWISAGAALPKHVVPIDQAIAASVAERPGITAELLVAVAYVESRFNPASVSRVEGGQRVTGIWASRAQIGEGPWFCGVLQARAATWARCLELRDSHLGYAAGATELASWLRRTGDIGAMLDGHGCGTHGVRTRRCNGYAGRVLRVHRRITAVGGAS